MKIDLGKESEKVGKIVDLYAEGKLDEAEDLSNVQTLILLKILLQSQNKTARVTEILEKKSNISMQHLGSRDKVKNLVDELTKQVAEFI